MRKEQYKRLEPFFVRRSARQRLILYLFACGMTVPELVNYTVKDLSSLALPEELVLSRDEVLDLLQESKPSSLVFVFPRGNPMTHTDFYRIVRQAAEMVFEKPMSRQQFVAYIKKGELVGAE